MIRGHYSFLGHTAATDSTATVEPVGDILKRMEVKRMRSFCNECTAISDCHLTGSAVSNCSRLIEWEIKQEAARAAFKPSRNFEDVTTIEPIRVRTKGKLDFSRIEAKRKERRTNRNAI